MREYKWKSPQHWLMDKINHEWSEEERSETLVSLVELLNADDIQELFQGEMDMDGYFDHIEPGDPEQTAAYFRLAQSRHIFLEKEDSK